jgi:hypothetical protein
MQDGRRNGSRLVELDRMIGHRVRTAIDPAGVAPILWPANESVRQLGPDRSGHSAGADGALAAARGLR